MPYFVQVDDQTKRVIAYTEAEVNPDPDIWIESPWDKLPDDFDKWRLVDGQLVYGPRPDDTASTLELEDVIRLIFSLSPGLAQAVPDVTARRMKPYLPAYDPMADYPEGALVTRGGSACRKTRTGWREIG